MPKKLPDNAIQMLAMLISKAPQGMSSMKKKSGFNSFDNKKPQTWNQAQKKAWNKAIVDAGPSKAVMMGPDGKAVVIDGVSDSPEYQKLEWKNGVLWPNPEPYFVKNK